MRLEARWLLSDERAGILGTTSWERWMLLLVDTRFLVLYPLSARHHETGLVFNHFKQTLFVCDIF